MKKIFTVLLLLVFLCSCSKTNNSDKSRYEAYLSYYETILETKEKKESSETFQFELVVNKLQDGSYRYDLIIDNPRIAMYNIKALAIIDGIYADKNKEEMMPSLGIFDDQNIALVPGQVDKDNECYKGFTLSLVSDKSALKISAIVVYNNSDASKTYKEFITIYGEYSE